MRNVHFLKLNQRLYYISFVFIIFNLYSGGKSISSQASLTIITGTENI